MGRLAFWGFRVGVAQDTEGSSLGLIGSVWCWGWGIEQFNFRAWGFKSEGSGAQCLRSNVQVLMRPALLCIGRRCANSDVQRLGRRPCPPQGWDIENRVLRVLEGFESVWDLIAIRLRLRPHQAHYL